MAVMAKRHKIARLVPTAVRYRDDMMDLQTAVNRYPHSMLIDIDLHDSTILAHKAVSIQDSK